MAIPQILSELTAQAMLCIAALQIA
jgi:hypothetical protein